MNTDDNDLLAALREPEPVGPGRVDLAAAVQAGHRRRRTIAAVRVTAAAVVVVAVVGAVLAVLPGRDRTVIPAGPPTGLVLDAGRQAFRIGSAGGFTPLAFTTGRYQQVAELGLERTGTATATATVTMYAAGRLPGQQGPGWVPAGERAPDVYGRAAYWLPAPGGTATLAWTWADDAWFVVSARADLPDLRTRVGHIAESVGAPADVAVAVPLTVAAPPGPLRLTAVRTSTAAVDTTLTFAADDQLPGAPAVEVTLAARTPEPPPVDAASTTVDIGGGYAVTVRAVPATAVEALGGRAVLDGLAASVHLVPDPANRRTWVAPPAG